MAVDGYLNFDTKINTSGFEKGTESISKVLATLDKSIKELAAAIKSVSDIKFTADTSEAEKAVADVAESVENISDPEIKIEADTSAVEPQIEATVSEIPAAEVEVKADTSQVENATEKAKQAVESVGEATEDIPSPQLDTSSAVSELDLLEKKISALLKKSIDGSSDHITQSLDKLKSQLKGVAAVVGLAFGVKEIVSFSKESIKSAAEINAANSQLEQTFGSLQSAAEEAMQRVAAASGIVATRLKGVGTSIYAFAKASGMDSVQALDMMEEALQVAADSAAYYDRSLEDTSESLKSFLKGNYANDAALGVSATETTRNAMANRLYGKSFQELSEAQKQLALLQMVKDANDLSGATGQAAREADGWENVLGNLKETWKQLLAVIGQPMLKVAVSAVQELTSALSFLLEKARIVVASLSEVFGWELGNTAAVTDNISQSVVSQNDLTEAVEETAKAQKKSVAGFDKINTLASETEDKTKKDDTIGQPLLASGNVPVTLTADTSGASKDIVKFINKVKNSFSKLNKQLRSSFSQLSKWLSTNFSPVFGKVWDGLVIQTQKLYQTIKRIFADIQALGPPLATYFKGDFTTMLQTALSVIGGILIGLYDSFNMVFSDIWKLAVYPRLRDFITIGLPLITEFTTESINAFGVLFKEVKSLFDMLWKDVARPILGFISKIWHDLMISLKKFWDKWGKPTFDKFCNAIVLTGNTLKTIWKSLLKPIFDALMKVIDKIWTKHLSPLVDNFLDFVGVLIDGGLDIYNKFILPVVNWFVKNFGPPIAKVFSFIAETIGNRIGGSIDVINSLVDTLKGVVTFIAGVFTGDWKKAWVGIKMIFSGVWNSLKNIVKVPINFIIDLLKGFINVLKGVVTFIAGVFKTAWKKAWKGIKKIFSTIWDSFENIVKVPVNLIIDLVNGLIGAIESGLNSIIKGINKISIDTPKWAGGKHLGFDLDEVSLPKIPKLAQGTVVPANYGNFLAVLGDNKRETEVVSPLSTIKKAVSQAMAENGGNSPKEIVLYTYLYPNSSAFHREVIKIVNSDKARKGV